MHFLIPLLIPYLVFGGTEIEDAKKSVMTLIAPLLSTPQKASKEVAKFRVDACPQEKINWMDVLLQKKEVTLHYAFKEGCDIQGTITPKLFEVFPASLQLRNIPSYSKIETKNRVTANLEAKPILNLAMREGSLLGKHKIKFEADYRVQLNPLSENLLEKNLGGELRITEINGKKTSLKEKIFVK